jgi:putative FmdB family regulatory protein
MPTYEYQCTDCGRRFDVVQSFSDAALTTCEECGGTLRKVFSAVGVVFKGSGFYKTDSRPSGAKPDSSSGESSSTGSGAEKPDPAPAKASETSSPAPAAASTASAPAKSSGD